MPARPKTPTRGAADVVAQAIDKLDRMMDRGGPMIDGRVYKRWLQDWDKRAAKKAGGLGKR